jgi:hypothetical protein
VSPDGLRLFFHSYRGGPGYGVPYISQRASVDAGWSSASVVSVLAGNPSYVAQYPIEGAMYCSWSGTRAIHRAAVDKSGAIYAPIDIDPDGSQKINYQNQKWAIEPVVTPDELHLYFMSNRDGPFLLYETHRSSQNEKWSPPVALPPVINATTNNHPFYITPDNCTLYYTNELNNADMYRVTRSK